MNLKGCILEYYQRTKSCTFARHSKPTHESQPCKRTSLVPTLPGHTLLYWAQYLVRHSKTKGERTMGLPKYELTLAIFGICNSTVLHIQLDIIYLAFCWYLQFQFFNHHRYRADGIFLYLGKHYSLQPQTAIL